MSHRGPRPSGASGTMAVAGALSDVTPAPLEAAAHRH